MQISRFHLRYSNPEVFMIRRAKIFLTSSHSNQYIKSDYVAQPYDHLIPLSFSFYKYCVWQTYWRIM